MKNYVVELHEDIKHDNPPIPEIGALFEVKSIEDVTDYHFGPCKDVILEPCHINVRKLVASVRRLSLKVTPPQATVRRLTGALQAMTDERDSESRWAHQYRIDADREMAYRRGIMESVLRLADRYELTPGASKALKELLREIGGQQEQRP